MSTEPIRFEHRGAQRFDYHLPVAIHLPSNAIEGLGFTQDVSASGMVFYTDLLLAAGDKVELTLTLPAEITMSENMRVRCRGQVVRVHPAYSGGKSAVAVHTQGYEYLPDLGVGSEGLNRVSSSHDHLKVEKAI